MNNIFQRLEIAVGSRNLEKIKEKKVIIFGMGGVGSYCVETLVRSGIENITLVDNDNYSITNLNRQLFAIKDTIGRSKVEVAKERILSINKNANVKVINKKVYKNIEEFNLDEYDYVVDCIDTIISKVDILEYCNKRNIFCISSMGFGNKFCPELIRINRLKNTKVCPLARALRRFAKKRDIMNTLVIYSTEENNQKKYINSKTEEEVNSKESNIRKLSPASNSFVPSVAGIYITSVVIRHIVGIDINYE